MPQLWESVVEGTVDRWLKQEGDLVRRDEPLVEVVTDKVNAEVPSPLEGRLVRIEVTEGRTVPIGTVLAAFDVEDELESNAGAPQLDAPAAASSQRQPVPSPETSPTGQSGRERLSPAVRRLAEENRVDLSLIAGTGAAGRITRDRKSTRLNSSPVRSSYAVL